jgi:hypothetical protein
MINRKNVFGPPIGLQDDNENSETFPQLQLQEMIWLLHKIYEPRSVSILYYGIVIDLQQTSIITTQR